MKEYKKHKFKFNPYLEKLYQSDEPLIIYKVENWYNIYTHFSKKKILTNKNINDNPFNILGPHKINGQWIVRVWMPEADEVNITFKDNKINANINLKWKKVLEF